MLGGGDIDNIGDGDSFVNNSVFSIRYMLSVVLSGLYIGIILIGVVKEVYVRIFIYRWDVGGIEWFE